MVDARMLVCPECHSPLDTLPAEDGSDAPGAVRCGRCDRTWPVRDGVACFLPESDAFYEGKFTGRYVLWPPRTAVGRLFLKMRLRWGIELQYVGMLRRHLGPRRRRILDLGCGGGNNELLHHGASVAGVDLSLASARNAAWIYDIAVQASATRLPFPDDYFDAVVSSNFLGHVPFEDKAGVYDEMFRVLRPDGIALHEIETDSEGAFFRHARRDSEFFQSQIIDLDGHVGQELPSETLERLRRHGFRIEWARTDFVWFFLPRGEALKRCDNRHGRAHPVLRALVALDRLLAPHPRLCRLSDFLTGLLNAAARRITPFDRGIGLCLAARPEKPLSKSERRGN